MKLSKWGLEQVMARKCEYCRAAKGSLCVGGPMEAPYAWPHGVHYGRESDNYAKGSYLTPDPLLKDHALVPRVPLDDEEGAEVVMMYLLTREGGRK